MIAMLGGTASLLWTIQGVGCRSECERESMAIH